MCWLPIVCDWDLGLDIRVKDDVFIFINQANPCTDI